MAKPVLQALVLCDQYYHDRETNKRIIAGTFNRIRIPAFPAFVPQNVFAYLCMTGVRNETLLQLRYVDLQDNEILMGADFSVTSNDPVASIEFAIRVPPLPIPRAGVYAIEIVSENELLGSWRIVVDAAATELETKDDNHDP